MKCWRDKSVVGRDGFTLQIGTLSGNPLAAVAGLKTLEILRRPDSYDRLRKNGTAIMGFLRDALDQTGFAYQIVGDPVLFDVVFTKRPVTSYRDVLQGDTKLAARFNAELRQQGIFKSAGKIYPCLALSSDDLSWTREAIATAAKQLSAG